MSKRWQMSRHVLPHTSIRTVALHVAQRREETCRSETFFRSLCSVSSHGRRGRLSRTTDCGSAHRFPAPWTVGGTSWHTRVTRHCSPKGSHSLRRSNIFCDEHSVYKVTWRPCLVALHNTCMICNLSKISVTTHVPRSIPARHRID